MSHLLNAWHNLVDRQTQLNQTIMALINTYIIIIYIKYIASMLSQKPRPDGSALAFCCSGRAKSHRRPSPLARLGPAYFGSAWPGSWPEAGPSTALVIPSNL